MHTDDWPAVASIFEQGIATRNATFETEAPSWEAWDDAHLPEHRLVAELDGYDTHGTRRAFERDRERDRKLQVAGYRVIRITWRQLTDEPDTIASELRELLRDTVSAS
jgi:very-short-patch-repair endonuclease